MENCEKPGSAMAVHLRRYVGEVFWSPAIRCFLPDSGDAGVVHRVDVSSRDRPAGLRLKLISKRICDSWESAAGLAGSNAEVDQGLLDVASGCVKEFDTKSFIASDRWLFAARSS